MKFAAYFVQPAMIIMIMVEEEEGERKEFWSNKIGWTRSFQRKDETTQIEG